MYIQTFARLALACGIATALSTAAQANTVKLEVTAAAFDKACTRDGASGRVGHCVKQGTKNGITSYSVCTGATAGNITCHTVRCASGSRRGVCTSTTGNSPARVRRAVAEVLAGGGGNTGGVHATGQGHSGSSGSSGGGSAGGGTTTIGGDGHAIGGGCSGDIC